jgi:hypothetical protein
MFSSREAVSCTVRDGAVCMLLSNVPVHFAPHLCCQSKVFVDALSSVPDPYATDQFTLAAPRQWLQDWVDFCCKKEAPLDFTRQESRQHSRLLVCFSSVKEPFLLLTASSTVCLLQVCLQPVKYEVYQCFTKKEHCASFFFFLLPC